jgi:hypothetical protein
MENGERAGTISKHEYWEQKLEQWRSSDLSMRAFCRREGISFYGLRYWRDKTQGAQRKRRAVKLSASLGAAVGSSRPIEVVVAERFTVRVPQGFQLSELERIIKSLEALR